MDEEYNVDDIHEEEDSLAGSQHNDSEHSKSLFNELSDSLSKLEKDNEVLFTSKGTSNKFIEHEQQNNRIGEEIPHSPSSKIPAPKPKLQTPLPEAPRPRLSIHDTSNQSPPDIPKDKSKSNDGYWILLTVVFGIIVAIIAYFMGHLTWLAFVTPLLNQHQTSAKPINCNDLSLLRSEFPQQSNELWAFLKSGVESVTNKKPTKPSIFMLLHEPDVDVKPILNKVVEATQKCLGTLKHTPIYLTSATLKRPEYLHDYGRVISDYKSALSDSGIMIVENFNEVPPYVAQAFHTICDGESPYVARSVIYITMPVKQINSEDNPFTIAEKELTALWASSLKNNVLGPLLYRVTDVTLHINREV